MNDAINDKIKKKKNQEENHNYLMFEFDETNSKTKEEGRKK